MDSSISYAGKKVYIGMDVHKKTYSVTAICEGVVVKSATMLANSSRLRKFLTNHFADAEITCAYEAGFSGFSLQRILESWGCECKIINPGSIEVASRDRVKTDKRDSKKLAEHLAHNRIHGINIPTVETEERRMLSRGRGQIVDERSRIAVQIKSKLYQLGLIDAEDESVMSKKYIEKVENLNVSPVVKFVLGEFCRLWKSLDTQIASFNKMLAEQAVLDSRLEKTYRSVPGLGPVSSRVLANELGDMSQFKNEDALFSFVGLTPTENSSGDASRKGHISRQGNPRVRHILVESAWRAIQKDLALREDYERISKRAGGRRAIVAIARRMIGRIRACFRKSELWRRDYDMAEA